MLANDRAFTLIETIVVTTLLGILLGVAIPKLSSGVLSEGGDETARWMIANVRHAKEMAVSQNKTYILNISLDNQRLWVAPFDLPETEEASAKEKGYRLPRGESLYQVVLAGADRVSGGTVPIFFFPQGYSDKAMIRISVSGGERMTFYIEPFLPHVNLVRGGGS